MTSLRAVVFDAVGTLMTPDPSAGAVYHHFGGCHGSRRTRDEVAHRFAAAFREGRDSTGDDRHRTDENREREFWSGVVSAVFDELPADALDACFRDLFEYFARPESWRVYPDVEQTLTALRSQGLSVAVASNFDARLHDVVAGHPELALLDRCFVSSEIGWKKPDRRFFTGVCDVLGCQPDEVLYIGDEPESDVAAANAAGLRSLLIRRDGSAACGLTDLREIMGELAGLNTPTPHPFSS